MYPKRFHPLDDPPTASSSDEEEEFEGNSSSEVEDESSKNPSMKKPQSPLQVSDSESDPEEESESESDSETERKEPVPNPQSPVVKSVTETKNQDSRKSESPAKSATKRSRETDVGGDSRDTKRVKKVSEEDTKKNPFRRIWSEEDEIMVLQGVINYPTKTGLSPFDDMTEFYQLVKKSLGFDASKSQVTEKLRALKKKYQNNLGKAKNGEEPTFSSSHDREVFELSKVIWGAKGTALESAVKPNDKSEKKKKKKRVDSVNVEQEPDNGKRFEDEVMTNNKEEASSQLGITELDTSVKSFLGSLARYGVDDLSAQQGWSKLASEDKKRFEAQWKTLQLREFEFYSQKTGFINEVLSKMAKEFR